MENYNNYQENNEFVDINANKDRNLPKQVRMIEAKVVTQQVIINGVMQNVEEDVYALACPDCGRVIFKFPLGVDYGMASRALIGKKDIAEGIAKYCPNCGRRLAYQCDEPIKVEENE